MVSDYLRISHLINVYRSGQITPEEETELKHWELQYPVITKWITNQEGSGYVPKDEYERYIDAEVLEDWNKIVQRQEQNKKKRNWRAWAAAACFAGVLLSGFFIYQSKDHENTGGAIAIVRQPSPVVPGKTQARLILSDGSAIGLEGQDEQIIEEGELTLSLKNKELNYANANSTAIYMHKIEIPKGGTYFIQLADGTKVWLNADSEMEFPTAFRGKERLVTLQGEAYFEVASDPAKPFRVQVNGTVVEAIGTAFNINTHWKEGRVKTILTEGKVKVEDGGQAKYITEGFAGISGGGQVSVEKADQEEAMAWRDGYFYFNGKNLPEILREISRWYDVSIQYEARVSTDKYKGGMKRTESIGAVCRMLEELSGLSLDVKQRTLLIRNK